ncbi:hypothetical protein AK812_SmicGene44270 [Symbiodinium microadriaticum]|uniref:Uncharacterized protein n=1 Tax=Symbiodinium microadriaticum TaxID=2951 RepID=A0A1Q9BZ43_SYMMI|nr:hypothetical protein AK812_SmicGene44270 [Symbiodinium microadriaticum]
MLHWHAIATMCWHARERVTLPAGPEKLRADSQAILPPASGWQTNCTESQTDLSPDQVSIVTATWFVSSGLGPEKPVLGLLGWRSCEILPESQCITTSSFPRRFYGSYEHCTIQVADNNTSPMQVLAFKTGSEDSLMVNGQSYSGTTGPDDVVPQGTIEWRAAAQL